MDKKKRDFYLISVGNDVPTVILKTNDVILGENGGDKSLEGDKKTPSGIYYIKNFIPDKKLPAIYGYGAFPLNYPNIADRIQRKTGSGIWIHGRQEGNKEYTEGCVVLNNDYIKDLYSRNIAGTPVVISDQLDFLDEYNYNLEKAWWLKYLNEYLKSWENSDYAKFKDFFHPEFQTGNGTKYNKYLKKKERLMAIYPYRKIFADQIKIFKEDDDAVVDFNQLYCADNIVNETRKKIYLYKESEVYKILAEEVKDFSEFMLLNKLMRDFINRWSVSWGEKNLQDYMNFYDENFISGPMNYHTWLEDKRDKFYKTGNIEITFDNVNVKILNPAQFSVTFRQKYSSKLYSDVGIKKLSIIGCPGDFKIVSESWRPLR